MASRVGQQDRQDRGLSFQNGFRLPRGKKYIAIRCVAQAQVLDWHGFNAMRQNEPLGDLRRNLRVDPDLHAARIG